MVNLVIINKIIKNYHIYLILGYSNKYILYYFNSHFWTLKNYVIYNNYF